MPAILTLLALLVLTPIVWDEVDYRRQARKRAARAATRAGAQ